MANQAPLSTILSVNAGYVDTVGFMALHGLFTAHVTGNFVTIGAALVLGTSGIIAKLLALPVFCAAVLLARLLHFWLVGRGLPVVRALLFLKFALLVVAALLAVHYGPFGAGDSWPATLLGMTMVTAMAIQNAVHRVHLASMPPSTLMTGTTTQIMLDLADRIHGMPAEQKTALDARLARMSLAVLAFAVGCAAAALLYAVAGMWCFAAPPIVALGAYLRYRDAEEVVVPK